MIPFGNLDLWHLNDTLSYLATVTGCWHPLTTRAVISEIKHVRFFEIFAEKVDYLSDTFVDT